MRIHNVRLGLASNSSSSHSFIILPGKALTKRSAMDELSGEFGWDRFTLDTADDKATYFAVALKSSLDAITSPAIRDMILNDLLGAKSVEGYIDHQSLPDFPHDYQHSEMIDIEFARAFRDWMLSPDVVILGGNDNGGDDHPLKNGHEFQWFFNEYYNTSDLVCRYDQRYRFWTIFNRYTGAKIRFSFDTLGRKETPITHASAPELVDLKITDHCPFGCEFCYQGSTLQGIHADTSNIMSVLSTLAELKVFEVAIGGGEPTLHPDFVKILGYAREMGIVPNFTTRNLAWLRDPAKTRDIMASAGAFAFSVHDESDLDKLAALIEVNGIDGRRTHVHIIMGLDDHYQFERKIKHAHDLNLPITLLGYKTAGFGANVKHQDYSWWLDSVQKAIGDTYATISIDTVLAAESEAQLKAYGVQKWSYHTQDGLFSAYIDAVNMTLAPSSYAGTPILIPDKCADDRAQWMMAQFRGFEGV